MIYLYITLIVLGFTTLIYIIQNLLKKVEKQEDVLVGYLTYLDQLSRVIELSDDRLQKVDQKGTFKSDDEVGFFFEEIKQIQDILNDFKLRKIE